MFTINNYRNFIIKTHRPQFVNINDFINIINQPQKHNDQSHIEELYNIVNCGIYLDNKINLLKNYNPKNFKYEKNLVNVTNKIHLRSMNVYKPEKKFNYKLSIAHTIRVYDMILAIQIRTILNPIENNQIQKDIDDIISNSVSNIDEQLLVVDIIMNTRKNN